MKSRNLATLAAGLLTLVGVSIGAVHAASSGADSAAVATRNDPVRRIGLMPPTLFYALEADSQYTQGCFPAPPFPCAGPLVLYPQFEGGFGVTVAGVDPDGFVVFQISALHLVASGGDQQRVVVGDGIYRRSGGTNPLHQLTLEVTVDGGPLTVFDSGVVPVPESDDAIDIAVSMNDLQNYDVLMHIVANPGSPPDGATLGQRRFVFGVLPVPAQIR